MNNDTVNIIRALGYKDDDGRVHLSMGECVMPNETAGEARPLCEAALESLRLADGITLATLRSLAEPRSVGTMKTEELTVPKLRTGEQIDSATLGPPPGQQGKILY